jgi:hypothetical protein
MAYETNAKGILSSHYDATIKPAGLEAMDFMLTKMGGSDDKDLYEDPTWASRVQLAYDTNTICGAFWFCGPRYWLERSQTMGAIDKMTDDEHPILVFIRKLCQNKYFHWLDYDIEKNTLYTSMGQVTEVWVKFYMADLVQRIQRQQAKGNIRPFKHGIYSSRSFMDGTQVTPNNPQTSTNIYLGVQPDIYIHPANWPSGTGGTKSLLELSQMTIPVTHIPKSFGYCPTRPRTWDFWQAYGDAGQVWKSTDVLTATGGTRPVCLEVFNGTVADLKAWAGITVTPPVPPVPPAPGEVVDLTARAEIASVKAQLQAIR